MEIHRRLCARKPAGLSEFGVLLRGAPAIVALVVAAAVAGCGDTDGSDGPNVSIVIETGDGAPVQRAGLIPRSELYGQPERFRGRLSPDGEKISWLAPHEGALNIWTAPADAPQNARPITALERDVRLYDWAANNTHIIFDQPITNGTGWRQFSVEVATGAVRGISPGGPDAVADVMARSWDYPDEIVLKTNDRDPEIFDLNRVNIVNGESKRVFTNDKEFVHYHVDNALKLRLAETVSEDGGRLIHRLDRDGDWTVVDRIPYEDSGTTYLFAFDGANQSVFALDSRARDAAALVRIDIDSWSPGVIAELTGVDVALPLLHPTTFELSAAMVMQLETEWIAFTPRAQLALSQLRRRLEGENIFVLARTIDDRRWIVYEGGAVHPGRYHVLDVESGVVDPMFDVRPELAQRSLAPLTPVIIEADDGLDLVSYLTLPPGADTDGDGRPERASPLVIIPYPSYRASPEFNADHQWLADRGYAVLAVTVRGARGLGKAFHAAGADVFDDATLADVNAAARWAQEKGIADPDRIAVAGNGHGGVLALALLSRDDPSYACALASNAPADLIALLEDPPAEWRGYAAEARRRFGDPSDPEQRARLLANSPTGFAARIDAPVLYVMGALGQAPQVAAAREAVETARANGSPASLLVFENEGGELIRTESRIALAAVAEQFFADCLGGAAEPIGNDLDVPGLSLDAYGETMMQVAAAVAPHSE